MTNEEKLELYLRYRNNEKLTDEEVKIATDFEKYVKRLYLRGSRISDDRIYYNNNFFEKSIIYKLIEIGFNFMIDEYEEEWQSNFMDFKLFKKEYGRNPDPTDIYYGNLTGRWLEFETVSYHKGKVLEDGSRLYSKQLLTPQHIELLKNEGYEFEKVDEWQSSYNEFVKYLEEHNNEYPSKEHKLYPWVKNNRLIYNKGRLLTTGTIFSDYGRLSKERVYALRKINFKFTMLDEVCAKNIKTKEDNIKVFKFISRVFSDYIDRSNIETFESKQDVINFNNGFKKVLSMKKRK